MIRTIFLSIVITTLFCNCNGQESNKKNELQKGKDEPQVNYKVNKEYDENGNLIRYDSTYSYYYSNVENDSVAKDSIIDVFKNQLNHQFFFSDDPFFNDFFFQDSLMMYDFYKKDFFSNRFKNNQDELNRLFWQMDSVKNEFFNKQYKESEPPKAKGQVYHL
jgi:hypothetical protein